MSIFVVCCILMHSRPDGEFHTKYQDFNAQLIDQTSLTSDSSRTDWAGVLRGGPYTGLKLRIQGHNEVTATYVIDIKGNTNPSRYSFGAFDKDTKTQTASVFVPRSSSKPIDSDETGELFVELYGKAESGDERLLARRRFRHLVNMNPLTVMSPPESGKHLDEIDNHANSFPWPCGDHFSKLLADLKGISPNQSRADVVGTMIGGPYYGLDIIQAGAGIVASYSLRRDGYAHPDRITLSKFNEATKEQSFSVFVRNAHIPDFQNYFVQIRDEQGLIVSRKRIAG